MNELDRKIKEALQQQDAELAANVGEEPSIFEMLFETFRGRHRWLVFLTFVVSLIMMVAAVFSVVKFFNATETRDMLMWAAASVLFLSGVSMMKVWYWMELNKNAITREIKRLELQVARLAARDRN